MNKMESPIPMEARIRYLDGDYKVLSSGSFVRCARTGDPIALEDLKYWSVARQEAYRDPIVSHQAELEAHPQLRKRG